MGAVRIIVLAVAAVAAIGLAFVVKGMTGNRAPPPVPVAAAPAEKPSVQVLVARRDLPIGTRISPADLGWQSWPADSLNPAFITDGSGPAAAPVSVTGKVEAGAAKVAKTATSALSGGGAMQTVTGAIVREPILSGEPVVERKIVRGGEGGYMSVLLQPGMRAMAVEVNVNSGAGGFILPGDRVDILMSRKLERQSGAGGGGDNDQTAMATTVLRNLRVLAVDQQVEPDKTAKAMVGATVTVEVPAGDVEILARAKAEGDLALALRSYADAGGPAGRTSDEGKSQSIRIIRAGKVTQVMTP